MINVTCTFYKLCYNCIIHIVFKKRLRISTLTYIVDNDLYGYGVIGCNGFNGHLFMVVGVSHLNVPPNSQLLFKRKGTIIKLFQCSWSLKFVFGHLWYLIIIGHSLLEWLKNIVHLIVLGRFWNKILQFWNVHTYEYKWYFDGIQKRQIFKEMTPNHILIHLTWCIIVLYIFICLKLVVLKL
jgi:hypothetical protein